MLPSLENVIDSEPGASLSLIMINKLIIVVITESTRRPQITETNTKASVPLTFISSTFYYERRHVELFVVNSHKGKVSDVITFVSFSFSLSLEVSVGKHLSPERRAFIIIPEDYLN